MEGTLLARGRCQNYFRRGSQVPDKPAGEHEADRDELGSAHDSSEHRAAAGIVSKELKKEPRNTIEKKICPKNLAVEFLAFKHPGKDEEDAQFHSGLEQLCGFEGMPQWSSDELLRERIGKCHAPEVVCRFSVAASCRKATESSN